MTSTRTAAFHHISPDGGVLAIEVPVAIEIDGIGYAAMMATPETPGMFDAGFCLSERSGRPALVTPRRRAA